MDIHEQLAQIMNSGTGTDQSEGEDGEVVYKELIPVVYEEKETGITVNDNVDLNADYKFARSNLYGLIGRSNAALDLALKIAAMSEHPRAIEVASNLMKASADITKDLLALQKAIEKQDKTSEIGQVSNTQINNYYGEKKEISDIDSLIDDLPDK